MRVRVVPVLGDNYSYLVIDEASKSAAAVDPAEPAKVLAAAQEEGVEVALVLTTHKHGDHAGGNTEMRARLPRVEVVGGRLDAVAGCTRPVEHGEKLSLGSLEIVALHTPCHTLGHISYFVTGPDGAEPTVFTGDTLFIAGCGRFFEGSAEQMYTSLCKTLGSLPPTTRVFCGHEYTLKNLEFAASIEPDNQAVHDKAAWVKSELAQGRFSVPSTIAEEKEYNPFMRVESEPLQRATSMATPVDVMLAVRRMKDVFGVGAR